MSWTGLLRSPQFSALCIVFCMLPGYYLFIKFSDSAFHEYANYQLFASWFCWSELPSAPTVPNPLLIALLVIQELVSTSF